MNTTQNTLVEIIRKTNTEKLSRLQRVVSSPETDPASVDLLETCLLNVNDISSQSRHKLHSQLLHWKNKHR